MREAGGTSEVRLAELRRRWEEDPASRLFLQLAEEYRRTGRSEEAVEVLRQGLERNPQYLSAQVALGRCLLDLGRPQAALVPLEQVQERDATHLVAAKLLVEAHLQRGDALRARRQLDLYGALSPGDPEIDGLRERIEALVLADAEPVEVAAPSPVAEAPRASTGPDLRPAVQGVAATPPAPAAPRPIRVTVPPLPDPLRAEPVHAAPGAGDNGRVLLTVGGGDPFPGLAAGARRRRYAEGLSGEGLFPSRRPTVAPPRPEGAVGLGPEATGSARVAEPAPPEALRPAVEAPRAGPAAESRAEAAPGGPAAVEVPLPGAPEDETLPFAVTPGKAPAPAEAPAEVPEEAPATATLGELYLRQGHHAEAERIFRAVLQQDPANAAAHAGLAALAGQRAQPAAGDGAGGAGDGLPESLTGQKIRLLRQFLAVVRAAAEHDVS